MLGQRIRLSVGFCVSSRPLCKESVLSNSYMVDARTENPNFTFGCFVASPLDLIADSIDLWVRNGLIDRPNGQFPGLSEILSLYIRLWYSCLVIDL